jgi:hypothetical protein
MGLTEVLALPQVTPGQWDARVDYDTWARKTATSQLFIHWGGSKVSAKVAAGDVEAEKAQLRSYEAYHIDHHGWRGLAYDWAIGNSGTLYRVRGLSRSAATSGDVDQDGYSNNVEGEALLFLIGTGTKPSAKALATGRRVVDALDYDEVYGHREARGTSTTCPGLDLMSWLESVRNEEDDMPTSDEVAHAVWREEVKDDATEAATVSTAVLLRRVWKEAHEARVGQIEMLRAIRAIQAGDGATADQIADELAARLSE